MDPVNPAPAGNPQLTTHLLVSHKKNKNFHPSKVSLKRVNFITKEVPILARPVPDAEQFVQYGEILFGSRRGCLRMIDYRLAQFGRANWFGFGIKDRPCTIQLKLHCQEATRKETEDGELTFVFKDLRFVLKVLDLDGTQLLLITEEDVCLTKLTDYMGPWLQNRSELNFPSATSMEVHYSWNKIRIQVGDSQMHELRDDQPLSFLEESQDFSTRISARLTTTYRERTMKKMLEGVVFHGTQCNPFQCLKNTTLRMSRFLEYLSKQAQATSSLSSQMQTVIREMVGKLVYYIEPFIVIFVSPVLRDLEQFAHSQLAVKMDKIFQTLVSLQTLNTLESLTVLEPCLYCDWVGMLTVLVNENLTSLLEHGQTVLESADRVNTELLERLYSDRSTPVLDLMVGIVAAIKGEEDTLFHWHRDKLLAFTAEYQCWIKRSQVVEESSHLVICFTPKQFSTEEQCDESRISKRLKLDALDTEGTIRVGIFGDLLMVLISERQLHRCSLKSGMEGPNEQNLSAVGDSIDIGHVGSPHEGGRNLTSQRIIDFLSVFQVNGKNFSKLRLYSVNGISSFKKDPVKYSEIILDLTDGKDGLYKISQVVYKILPRNLVVTGYTLSSPKSAGAPRVFIRLRLFRFDVNSNEVWKLAEDTHNLDLPFLSQPPIFTLFGESTYLRANIGTHRRKIFCMVQDHLGKPVLQVYCFHRNRFIAIGGTNCNKPGAYLLSRNGKLGFYWESVFGGILGMGWTSEVNFKRDVITYKFFEWQLSF